MSLLKELLARIVHTVRSITRDQPSEHDVYAPESDIKEVDATITISHDEHEMHVRSIRVSPKDPSLRTSTSRVLHPYPIGTHKGRVGINPVSGNVVNILSL